MDIINPTIKAAASDWRGFAMGPRLRAFLGIDSAQYLGQHQAQRSEAEAREFTAFLSNYLRDKGLDDSETLTDLLDELVSMDLPAAVLQLSAEHADLLRPEDFRAQLSIAVASMLEGNLENAETRFRIAQAALPAEPAPYVNLVQIFLQQQRDDEAELWCVSGLDADPNNLKLWDLMAMIYRDRFGDYTPDRLLQLAEKRSSWAGLSLAANLTTTGDRYLKQNLLERLYHQGERDHQFLIELTGAMGVAGEMDRIPPIVWQAERMTQLQLPWQLHVHSAQAHLSNNMAAECLSEIAKAKRDPYMPDEVKEAVAELEEEAQALLADPTAKPSLH